MQNKAEFAWVIGVTAAMAFATFMVMFGIVVFIYWLLRLVGLAA